MSQTQNRLELYDFLIIFMAGSVLSSLIQSGLLSADFLPERGSTVALFTGIWLQEGILLAAIAFFLKYRQANAQTIALQPPAKKLDYIEAVLWGMAVYVLMIWMVAAIRAFWPGGLQDQNVQVYMHADDSAVHIALVVLTMCVLAPITEEILYRGYLFTSLLRMFSPKVAMLIASFFFACVHFDMQRFIPLFFGGLILNYFAWRKQSILASTVVHGVWNFSSIASYYIFT